MTLALRLAAAALPLALALIATPAEAWRDVTEPIPVVRYPGGSAYVYAGGTLYVSPVSTVADAPVFTFCATAGTPRLVEAPSDACWRRPAEGEKMSYEALVPGDLVVGVVAGDVRLCYEVDASGVQACTSYLCRVVGSPFRCHEEAQETPAWPLLP